MKGLKMMTNSGNILYDSSWIAGMNDIEEEEPEEYEEYENEDSYDKERDTIDPDELAEVLEEDTIQENHTHTDSNTVTGGNEDIENEMNIDNDDDENNEEEEVVIQPRRSTRTPKPTIGCTAFKHQGYSQVASTSVIDEYNETEAKVLTSVMCQFKERMKMTKIEHGNQYVVTYSLRKGIKEFGEQGKQSVVKEMKQLHDRNCFKPVNITTLSPTEKKRALESLIFLTEKQDGTIKARHCANGSVQREWMSRENVSSPTVNTESTLLTAVIEAEEGREVATCDIPNAFIQTQVEEVDQEGNRTIMNIKGSLIDILCEMDPS